MCWSDLMWFPATSMAHDLAEIRQLNGDVAEGEGDKGSWGLNGEPSGEAAGRESFCGRVGEMRRAAVPPQPWLDVR